jgi:hypothetical protein
MWRLPPKLSKPTPISNSRRLAPITSESATLCIVRLGMPTLYSAKARQPGQHSCAYRLTDGVTGACKHLLDWLLVAITKPTVGERPRVEEAATFKTIEQVYSNPRSVEQSACVKSATRVCCPACTSSSRARKSPGVKPSKHDLTRRRDLSVINLCPSMLRLL